MFSFFTFQYINFIRKFILIFWFCEKGRLEEVGRFGKCRAELECALIVCSPNHILRPAVFSKISDFFIYAFDVVGRSSSWLELRPIRSHNPPEHDFTHFHSHSENKEESHSTRFSPLKFLFNFFDNILNWKLLIKLLH